MIKKTLSIDILKCNQRARVGFSIVEHIKVIKMSVLITIIVYRLHSLNRYSTLTNYSD